MQRIISALAILILISLAVVAYWQRHRPQEVDTARIALRGYPITLRGFTASAAWFRRNYDGFPPIVEMGNLILYAPIPLHVFAVGGCIVMQDYSTCSATLFSRMLDFPGPQAPTILRNCPKAT